MRKLISALICIIMILSVVPMVSQAVEVITPVFIDFEDFEGGDNKKYKDDYIEFALATKNYETPVIDAEHGKSIELLSSGSMNLYSRLTKNAVFGFSYYSNDTNAGFAVSSKATNSSKTNDGWVDVDAFVKVDGSSIKLGSTVLESNTYTKGSWIDFAFGVDYTNHEIDLYIDGKYITTYETGKDDFKGTDRFLFGTIANRVSDSDSTKAATHYFDNMFVYYPPVGATANVTGVPGDSAEKDEITVDFGQNVILPSDSLYVTLDGDEVEAEPVVNHGYVTGLKIKNLSLSGGTEYMVAFPGTTDFLGNGISNCVFTTDSVEPQISIVRKNPDVVYEVGDSADFKIESAYLSGNNIDIYHNGEVCETLSSNATEFSIEVVGGNNEIYVEVTELSLKSNTVEIFVDNTPSVSISKQGAGSSYSVGDRVKFNISSANLGGNSVEIYHNGSLAEILNSSASEFTVVLTGGNNTVFAKVPEFGIKTETITLLVDEVGPINGTVKFFDFEKGEKGISDLGEEVSFKNKDEYSGSIKVMPGDDEHGQSLCFSHDTSTVSNKPRIIVESFQDKKGVYSFEADFKFSRVDERTAILPLKCQTGKGEETFSLYILDDGKLYVGSDVICDVKPNEWYNFRATWNSDTKKSDLYVNGEKKAAGIEFSKNYDIDSFLYVNIIMVHKAGEISSMYLDNIKSCFLAKKANVESMFVGSDASEVPYENTIITLDFDQTMNADSLKGVKLTSEIGKVISVDFTSDDNLTFTATVTELSPNTNYSIDLSAAKAESGVGISTEAVSFKTQKAPFAIKGVKSTAAGSVLNVEVSIQNNNAEEKSYIVIVALYSGNMMISSDAKTYKSNKEETAEFSIVKPDEEYEVEVYIFDSVKSLNLFDKFVVE